MKTKTLFFLLMMAASVAIPTSVKAQEEETEILYNFAYSYPHITYSVEPYPKVLFVSPVKECKFSVRNHSPGDSNNLYRVGNGK